MNYTECSEAAAPRLTRNWTEAELFREDGEGICLAWENPAPRFNLEAGRLLTVEHSLSGRSIMMNHWVVELVSRLRLSLDFVADPY